uniref:Uncharacterized protein n=1 Tax=Myotis myotis TaxID=51298 RepID=A0A7J7SRZ5_MYOMY|nr:hypothetical protein mMyoMyo1_009394 [Myotis myotis]
MVLSINLHVSLENGHSASSCLTAVLEEEQNTFLRTPFWDRRSLQDAPKLPGLHTGLHGNLTGGRVRVRLLFVGLVSVQFYPWQLGTMTLLKKKTTHQDSECWNDQAINSLMQEVFPLAGAFPPCPAAH